MKIKIGAPAKLNISTTGGIAFLRQIGFWFIRISGCSWNYIEIDGEYETQDTDHA
jgi:hypothetical protein